MARRICLVCGHVNENFIKECTNCGNSDLSLTKKMNEGKFKDYNIDRTKRFKF